MPVLGDGRYASGQVIKDGQRICRNCQTWKPFDCYGKNKSGVMGLKAICRECENEKSRARYANSDISERRKEQKRRYDKERYDRLKSEGKLKTEDPKVVRERVLKRNYGMTIEDYDSMVKQQSNRCLICSASGSDQKDGKLVVDHCHASGKVRGLLCNKCNLLLGHADDLIGRLESAILYLRERGEG